MARVDEILGRALAELPDKPSDESKSSDKKAYSEQVSAVVARAFAEELRERGMPGALPGPKVEPGSGKKAGAERRMAGGIGAKKVDVTWATEESGLILSISVKTINFCDKKSGNFQKNLTNRRGDMLIEAVTLHRRFPYAVITGVFFFDKGASEDATERRRSTFINANYRFQLFSGRDDPTDRDEQFERMYLVLLDSSQTPPTAEFFRVGKEPEPVQLEEVFSDFADLVASRNPDFYESLHGEIRRSPG